MTSETLRDIPLTTILIPGNTLGVEICASEKAYARLLHLMIPHLTIPDEDPKTLRWNRTYNSFAGNTYHDYAQNAHFEPYLVVHTTGQLADWRKPFERALWKKGHHTVHTRSISDEHWKTHTAYLIAGMLLMIYGSDIVLYQEKNAGRFSHFEIDVAEALDIPIYKIKDGTPIELADEIHTHHYPRRFIPHPNPDLLTIFKRTTTDDLTKHAVDYMLLASGKPSPPEIDLQKISTRRGHVLPWEQRNSYTVIPPTQGYDTSMLHSKKNLFRPRHSQI